MPLDPTQFAFFRAQVGATTPLPPPPPGCRLERVWRVLDAQGVQEHGPVHNRTAFLEDQGHDWKVARGSEGLRYSTRQGNPGEWLDLLLDYRPRLDMEAVPPRFDPMTGEPVAPPPVLTPARAAFDPTLHVRVTVRPGLRTANDLPPPPPGRTLQRIWTVIDGERLEAVGPKHNDTGFIEEKHHDWALDPDGRLRFYSRVVETDRPQEVVLDYETAAEMHERLFGTPPSPRRGPKA